jgi:hypothetical protein
MKYCTEKFDANPDVSGVGVSVSCCCEVHHSPALQIIIAFYVQGGLNLTLFYYSWVLKHSPSKLTPKQTKLKDWTENLLEEFLFGSVAAAYALCIAAFTQLNDISTYHLFLCDTFLSALTTVLKNCGSLIIPSAHEQKPFDRTLRVYFLGNQLLLVAMKGVTIHRLSSVWDNTGGKCFIGFIDGTGGLNERDDAVLWLYIDLIWGVLEQAIAALVVLSGWSKIWAPQNSRVKLMLTILFGRIPGAFSFIWNLHWTIKLTVANKILIRGNEYSFGFGQVGVLVTLVLSLYRVHISYQGGRCILWLGRSNSDRFVLEHNRQQSTANDNQTTLSDKSNLVLSSLPTPVTSRK